jgi:hypothetical protein
MYFNYISFFWKDAHTLQVFALVIDVSSLTQLTARAHGSAYMHLFVFCYVRMIYFRTCNHVHILYSICIYNSCMYFHLCTMCNSIWFVTDYQRVLQTSVGGLQSCDRERESDISLSMWLNLFTLSYAIRYVVIVLISFIFHTISGAS